jgi:hypothetical protein
MPQFQTSTLSHNLVWVYHFGFGFNSNLWTRASELYI